MAFTFHSSSPDGTFNDSISQPTSSTALNFFAALHVGGLKKYTASDLGLLDIRARIAGVGGNASIEIGRLQKKQLVAVKRSRVLSESYPSHPPLVAFDRHFDQLVLELRILGHNKIRKNPHIVNILGVCMDEFNGVPALDLVLEYSSLGSLNSFLVSNGLDISITQRTDLLLQVAKGLAAFHDLKISHGDVKIQNVLVFPLDNAADRWLAKVSDCGESSIAPRDDPAARLEPRIGTRLLNAPEIRKWDCIKDGGTTIEDAMLTDIFSFGLLAWEVCKEGKSFFDYSWAGSNSRDMDIDSMEEFLNNLPNNQLQEYGLEFLQSLGLEQVLHDRLSLLLKGALQDNAGSREPMSKLIEILEEPQRSEDFLDMPDNSSSESIGDILGDLFGRSLSSWTTSNSLYELLDYGRMLGNNFIDDLPRVLRERILSELKALATNEVLPQNLRAHAAMTVSECYTVGFSGQHDSKEVLAWFNIACSQGLGRANLWYYRICDTFGVDPIVDTPFEPSRAANRALCARPSVLYLIDRIHLFNRETLQNIRQSVPSLPWDTTSHCVGDKTRVTLFNDAVVDEIEPLHLAAWLGEDAVVVRLLQHNVSPLLQSRLGFNAAHYACLGGHLSTLRTLITSGTPMLGADFHNITPLHFSIFFAPEDIHDALGLLFGGNVPLETRSTSELKWDAHDLLLHGTALDWAVSTRYRALVQYLAPRHKFPTYGCLLRAIGSFFWEIVEDLMPYFKGVPDLSKDYTRLQTISRPFSYWIAHGPDGPQAIENTVRLCKKYGLLGYNEDGSTHLQSIVSSASTEDDFRLTRAVIDVSCDSYIKHKTPGIYGTPVLQTALQRSKHNDIWFDTIRELASRYTIDELQDESDVFGNFLAAAIQSDSVVGARVLLGNGVDINKPTFRFPPSTAIFDCISMFGSTEMISLLIENGADLLSKHPILETSPLQWLIMGRGQKVLLDSLLKYNYHDAVYFQSLKLALEGLNSELRWPGELRADSREVFRYLLTQERFTRHIDSIDSNGRTLIQQASYYLHADSVRLLLDAQANANIPFWCDQGHVLPLQIACSQGRGLHAIAMQEGAQEDTVNRERRSHAMEVATELLRWHHARGDSAFQGITELHLACRMIIMSEVEELMRKGYSSKAKGSWPGVKEQITPRDLLTWDMQDSTVTNIFPNVSLWDKFDMADPKGLCDPRIVPDDDISSTSSVSDL
ncbi:hypothetical protein F5X99DRAFT_406802 [Biscogniauxia marginata]|nr:hypothetical protein F5X99DRAFT_406802 [Biscogniauxia marginata]